MPSLSTPFNQTMDKCKKNGKNMPLGFEISPHRLFCYKCPALLSFVEKTTHHSIVPYVFRFICSALLISILLTTDVVNKRNLGKGDAKVKDISSGCISFCSY